MNLRQAALTTLLTLSVLTLTAHAQDKTPNPPAEDTPAATRDTYKAEQAYEAEVHTSDCGKMLNHTMAGDCSRIHAQTRTIFLKNASSQNDANELLVGVRNMFDPGVKVYLNANLNAISLTTYPEELARIEAYIHSLDIPHRAYTLTYTFVDSDSGKRVGVQHLSIVDVAGQRTTLKQGSKVPVATGTYSQSGTAGSQTQFTYLDVGMNIDATLTQVGDNLQLKTKVEQSSIGESSTIAGVVEPVVRQSVFDGIANLTPGKPVALGQIDLQGTTHHIDIEVVAEPIP
jgi:type II secretory pathway component GspD/PulD (secretin)